MSNLKDWQQKMQYLQALSEIYAIAHTLLKHLDKPVNLKVRADLEKIEHIAYTTTSTLKPIQPPQERI